MSAGDANPAAPGAVVAGPAGARLRYSNPGVRQLWQPHHAGRGGDAEMAMDLGAASGMGSVSEPARVAAADEAISADELQLAARNHGLPLEALRFDVTPTGLHYLLTHYDIPVIDPARLPADDRRPGRHAAVAGPGRDSSPAAALAAGDPGVCGQRAGRAAAAAGQPAVAGRGGGHRPSGPALRWRPCCGRPGLRDGAVEVVFTGADHGIERGVEQDYQRSLPVAECLRDDVLLAYEMNDEALPPQHGYPAAARRARLVRHGPRQVAHRDQRGRRAVRRVPDARVPVAAAAGRRGSAAHPHRAAGAARAARVPGLHVAPAGCCDPGGPCSKAAPGRDGRR